MFRQQARHSKTQKQIILHRQVLLPVQPVPQEQEQQAVITEQEAGTEQVRPQQWQGASPEEAGQDITDQSQARNPKRQQQEEQQ